MWISSEQLDRAAQLLQSKAVVAFPTETVYGLGADATSSQAIRGIYQAKGRPSDNPLIVHIAQRSQLMELTTHVPPKAQQLMDQFWPGPLTIILNVKRQAVAPEVTAGLSTIAIRMPDHVIALNLIAQAGRPIAAPSANTSGKPSPTTAQHVIDDLDGKIAAIVDGGETGVGLESTVIDLTSDVPTILRPGGVSAEAIMSCIGPVEVASGDKQSSAPKSPGMKYRHYSPDQPVWIVETDWSDVVAKLLKKGEKIGILASDDVLSQFQTEAVATYSLGAQSDVTQASQLLYSGLRALDKTEATIILVQAHPKTGLGVAYMNRLEKASSQC
ncbi:L-threonylcarbamoyladenylate synthase [Dolosigranulum savutiense]|uniref:Threonylcarbamoyl-AMP synthase n=1 Tax=Dolosigranulum savutiense TaxID=3110288 RepID=A0AB74TYP4_9LACT